MKKDYRYLAGIIDGEGWIGIVKIGQLKGYIEFRAKLNVTNTSEELIFWLKENFDGCMQFRKEKRNNQKDCYRWDVSSRKAVNIVKKVLPYLIVKKQQAKLLIRFQKTFSYKHGKNGIPEKVLQQREEFRDLMKQLNKKGKVN